MAKFPDMMSRINVPLLIGKEVSIIIDTLDSNSLMAIAYISQLFPKTINLYVNSGYDSVEDLLDGYVITTHLINLMNVGQLNLRKLSSEEIEGSEGLIVISIGHNTNLPKLFDKLCVVTSSYNFITYIKTYDEELLKHALSKTTVNGCQQPYFSMCISMLLEVLSANYIADDAVCIDITKAINMVTSKLKKGIYYADAV